MTSKEERDYLQEHYGFNFPMKAKYKRNTNRIYFCTDFEDGEEIEFYHAHEKPNANANGTAIYRGCDNGFRTMICRLEELEAD